MRKLTLFIVLGIVLPGMIFYFSIVSVSSANPASLSPEASNLSSLASTPVFRFPVIPNATISGYFDHQGAQAADDKMLIFYNGKHNTNSTYGFQFECENPSMNDFVGCEDNVSGEPSCNRGKQLWYDGHKGTDFEYSPDWYTGSTCDLSRFSNVTRKVYAAASGQVRQKSYDVYNGYFLKIVYDLNGNGNYSDDNLLAAYLHFVDGGIVVQQGDIVLEGQYLGLGGMTGYASTPHMHFEVQRSTDNFQNSSNRWAVDPFGWQGTGNDPDSHPNYPLWKYIQKLPIISNAPTPITNPCTANIDMINNGGFELGHTNWTESGYDIINDTSDPSYNGIPAYEGFWLAWLGGRDNALDIISQTFYVPPGTISGDFRFLIRIGTYETDPNNVYDRLYINLYNSAGNLLRRIRSFDDNSSTNNWWWIYHTPIDLSSYQGQHLTVKIEASTDMADPTSFYIDGVIFNTACSNVSSLPNYYQVVSYPQPTPTLPPFGEPIKPTPSGGQSGSYPPP